MPFFNEFVNVVHASH